MVSLLLSAVDPTVRVAVHSAVVWASPGAGAARANSRRQAAARHGALRRAGRLRSEV